MTGPEEYSARAWGGQDAVQKRSNNEMESLRTIQIQKTPRLALSFCKAADQISKSNEDAHNEHDHDRKKEQQQ